MEDKAVELGKLMRSVEILTDELRTTNENMHQLNTRITEIEARYRAGKAVAVGVFLGVGFAVKGVWDTFSDVLGGS